MTCNAMNPFSDSNPEEDRRKVRRICWICGIGSLLAIIITIATGCTTAGGGNQQLDIDALTNAVAPYLDQSDDPDPPAPNEPDTPNPPPVIEGPEPEEPEEPTLPEPEVEPVLVDYSKFWSLKLEGHFKANYYGRFVQADGTKTGVDIFRWGGDICYRLYDDNIVFTEGIVGDVSSSGPPNHYASSKRQSGTADWRGTLELRYDPGGKSYLFRNGELIGEHAFVIKRMPPVRSRIKLYGFEGEITQD